MVLGVHHSQALGNQSVTTNCDWSQNVEKENINTFTRQLLIFFYVFFCRCKEVTSYFSSCDLLVYSKLGDSFVTLSVLSVGCPLVCSIPGEFLLF